MSETKHLAPAAFIYDDARLDVHVVDADPTKPVAFTIRTADYSTVVALYLARGISEQLRDELADVLGGKA